MSTVRFTSAACQLAKCIYYSRAQAFDLIDKHWDALDATTRALYIDQAQQILQANRPHSNSSLLDTFAAITKQHAAKVVGRIDPSTPWGESA